MGDLTRLLQLALADESDSDVKQELCRCLLRQGFNMNLFASDYYRLEQNSFRLTINFDVLVQPLIVLKHQNYRSSLTVKALFDLQTLLKTPDLLTKEFDRNKRWVTQKFVFEGWEFRRTIDTKSRSELSSFIIQEIGENSKALASFGSYNNSLNLYVFLDLQKIILDLQKIVSDACNILLYRNQNFERLT